MAGREGQTLPGKEANLFRQIVKFYETKQYKKGLKAADQILKKFPEHGETLAMKGLTLNCLERKEEAYELVKKGLKNDVKSHVCWHVYGLLWRSDRNYDEAIKCYKNALRLDKENLQILRDLALLQVQMRDLQGFVETRHQLLQLKPANRNNWIAFAIAHHLNKNYELAVQILEAYEGTLEDVPSNEAYENSEMLLYKASILEEGSLVTEALAELDKHQDLIKDRIGMLETQARMYLTKGSVQEAEQVYRKLLSICPDNYRYHKGLQAAYALHSGLQEDGSMSEKQRTMLIDLYNELRHQYPKCSAVHRIPLDIKVGDEFLSAADDYVRTFLRRGVPSLFTDLKPLYKDPAKAEALGLLFERLRSSLEASSSFPPASGEHEATQESPQVYVWTLFYLAQHYDMLGDSARALSSINECIQHTPTLIELYSVKSKILKHAGDPQGAAAAADLARSLDLADRYLNSIAVKRMFRAGDIEAAERLAALFTKDGDQVNNLFDMQCMWYEIEAGKAHLQNKAYGKALKNFSAVTKHFADFTEDQFDFHSYCIRKMTLRSYIRLLRMEDSLYSHQYYFKAGIGAITAYLALYGAPSGDNGGRVSAQQLASMSAEERKKVKQKQKKAAAKKAKEEEAKQKEAAERAAKEKASGGKKGTEGAGKKEKDLDPDGVGLASTDDPLGEATKILTILKDHAGDRPQTHAMAFEVYVRKGKLLLALQSVMRARHLCGAPHPLAHRLLVRFCTTLMSMKDAKTNGTTESNTPTNEAGSTRKVYKLEPPAAVVQQVIDDQVKQLLGSCSTVQQYNEQYCSLVAEGSLLQRAAASEMMYLLQPTSKTQALQLILDDGVWSGSTLPSHADCVEVHTLLLQSFNDAAAADQWKQKCRKVFRWSAHFEGDLREVLDSSASNGIAQDLEKLAL